MGQVICMSSLVPVVLQRPVGDSVRLSRKVPGSWDRVHECMHAQCMRDTGQYCREIEG